MVLTLTGKRRKLLKKHNRLKSKKSILIALTAILLIVGFGYFYSKQHYFKTYHIPTTASEPALMAGDIVMGSSLITPQKNDFIIFLHYSDFIKEEAHFVFRMVATEGDTIQIKNSVTYVNGVNIDKNLDLKHGYYISGDINKKVLDALGPDTYLTSNNPTTYVTHITKQDLNKLKGYKGIIIKRMSKNKDDTNNMIRDMYNQPWNEDWFGPLIIPEKKAFVMGDNRNNAMDSRAIGLIDKHKIVATVLK